LLSGNGNVLLPSVVGLPMIYSYQSGGIEKVEGCSGGGIRGSNVKLSMVEKKFRLPYISLLRTYT
jgi:hypothetical protein